jgi:hypothetical protein
VARPDSKPFPQPGGVRNFFLAVVALLLTATVPASAAQSVPSLSHRVWVAGDTPQVATLEALKRLGVDGFVVPIGSAVVSRGATTLTQEPFADLSRLSVLPVSIAVWVSGRGDERGDAASFWSQLAPTLRQLPGTEPIVLVTRRFWSGLPTFAAAVARQADRRVEVVVPAVELAKVLPRHGWPAIEVTAVALGQPDALGFPAALLDDELAAIDDIDHLGIGYRVAVVALSRLEPEPPSRRVDLRPLLSEEAAHFRVTDAGDVFALRKPLAWGGETLPAGSTVTLRLVDAARYARDLGLLLRPVRDGLRGWDTVTLPPPAPTAGMSREAFLDFLRGSVPYAQPQVSLHWLNRTRVEVSISNTTPYETGIGVGSNFVQLRFSGTEVLDVQLGEFLGTRYGATSASGWHAVPSPRGADTLRLYYLFLPPHEMVGGAVVSFVSQPRDVTASWSELTGASNAVTGQ